MRGFVQAKVLLDPTEAVGVMIDSHRDFMDMVVHAFHIGANSLKFGADPVESLRNDAVRRVVTDLQGRLALGDGWGGNGFANPPNRRARSHICKKPRRET